MVAMAGLWLLLIAMGCFYVSMLAYGYVMIGLADVLPIYIPGLTLTASRPLRALMEFSS